MKLITRDSERRAVVQNTLRPIWMQYPDLEAAMRRTQTPKVVMETIDRLKALGFRHASHNTPESFKEHILWIQGAGLAEYLDSIVNELEELEIVPIQARIDPSSGAMFESFYEFWLKACAHLFASATFTLVDQKYWALLDLEKMMEEERSPVGGQRYQHVLVDEFQDVNALDLQLISAIRRYHNATLAVIGDDDQAIYEWRGATPSFVLEPDAYHYCSQFAAATFLHGTSPFAALRDLEIHGVCLRSRALRTDPSRAEI